MRGQRRALCDELLNGEIFYSLKEAQIVIEQWQKHFNTIRPHSAFNYMPSTPAPGVAFSIMDFLPTFAHIVGGKMPTDRPIDGVDQTDVLLGNSAMGHRESLLSFIGGDLVAVRWKRWRVYFTDIHPTGSGPANSPDRRTAAPIAAAPTTNSRRSSVWSDIRVMLVFPSAAAAGSPRGDFIVVCSR